MNFTAVEKTPNPTLSIVAPCYNEVAVLPEFLRRSEAAAKATGLQYEIVLVDDGSRDGTWKMITDAAQANPRIRGLRLLRNHGHQLALSAGMQAAGGDLILAIDADLQDPPELVSNMISLLQAEDADIVYGQRKARAGETRFKRRTAYIFYRFLRIMANVDIPPDTGDFRLMRRDVVQVLNAMPERHRFLRGMVAWIGGHQIPLLYDRDPRFAGETKYPLRSMIRLALDAITSFSKRPLILATYAGVGTGLLSLVLGIWSVVSYFLHDTVAGWTSIMTVVSILFALQFFFFGVMGEYIGRIFETNQQRPLYIVRNEIGQGLMVTNDLEDQLMRRRLRSADEQSAEGDAWQARA